MPHKAEKLLADIVAAGRTIQTFVREDTRESYSANLMLRSAVERQLEILGEALRRLEVLDPALVNEISEHRRIIAFRNVIAHGYDAVDDDVVWQAVTEKLPVLISEAEAILTRLALS